MGTVRYNHIIVLCLIFSLFTIRDLSGQVVINEFQASNLSFIQDPDFHEFSDWIELYNAGSSGTDISGYYLTDNLLNKTKWQIPAGTFLPANAYLLIWADGMNSGLHAGFKLSGDGEEIGLFNPQEELIDTVTFSIQYSNVSFGRDASGTGWLFFPDPTPGAPNGEVGYPGISGVPQFSLTGGFYDSAITLDLSSNETGAVIRYTTDGSEPDASSLQYVTALSIPVTTVLRARIYDDGMLAGKTVSHTYFIHEQEHDMPVLSIFTGPDNLWDPLNGIYVNYEEDWEKPCGLEYFTPAGESVFSTNAGLSIFGGASRGAAQKSLAVYARSEYGDGPIEYPLLPGRETGIYKSFVLRNSANDWSGSWRGTMFRDALMQTIVENRADLDYQAYQPAVIYLNGEYWGILNLRDKQNEDYCEVHYGIDRDSVDIIKNNDAVAGNDLLYTEMMNFLKNNDLSTDENYQVAASMIDIDEFISYMITEIYCCNIDWPANNHRLWRPEAAGGKWRWMLFDMDFGFNGFQWAPPSTNMFPVALNPDIDDYVRKGEKAPWATMAFIKLTQNETFRKKFISAFISQVGTTYNPGRVIHIVDSLSANLENEMPRHIARWSADGGITSMPAWRQNIQGMRDFANQRPHYALSQLAETFGLQQGDKVPVEIICEDGGKITLDGTPLDSQDFTAEYYKGLVLNLSLSTTDSYRFIEWTVEDPSVNGGEPVSFTENPVEINIEGATKITARLESDDDIPELKINEIMAGNTNGIVDEFGNHDDWIEIYNAGMKDVDLGGLFMTDSLGKPAKWKIPATQPEVTTVPAGGFIVLWADNEPDEGVLHLGFKLDKSGEQAGLFKQIGEDMVVIDSVSFPALSSDISLARYPDGTGPWSVAALSTPGYENSNTGVERNYQDLTEPVVYPNPTTGIIRIKCTGKADLAPGHKITLSIIDFSGRTIRNLTFTDGESMETDLSDMPAGLYLVRLTIGGKYFTRQVILMK